MAKSSGTERDRQRKREETDRQIDKLTDGQLQR